MSKAKLARLSLIPAAVMAGASNVMAAVPAEVTSAVDTMKTDATTIAGAVLVAIIAVLAFKFLRKAF